MPDLLERLRADFADRHRIEQKLCGAVITGLAVVLIQACSDATPPAPTVATVQVTASTDSLTAIGATLQCTATALDADGTPIFGTGTIWTTGDSGVATVSPSGLVTAIGNGTATIAASIDGVTGRASVRVTQVAVQLAFTAATVSARARVPIVPAFRVAIRDARGNAIEDAANLIALSIGANPGGGTLSGTVVQNAVAGVATFADLSVDQSGVGYTLIAASDGLRSAATGAFEILDFTVNDTGDASDGVCNMTHCSLREALEAANAHVGLDTIAFDIPGEGPFSIRPEDQLPFIADPVVIDGYTQRGASPNVNGPGEGSNAVLMIELDGSKASANKTGLYVISGGSALRGLVINRFASSAILIEGSGNNVVEGCFIGTDPSGAIALGNSSGITVHRSYDNRIGGSTPAARNVISANNVYGVYIFNAGAVGNLVQGNLIGTNRDGSEALGNGWEGVGIFDAGGNVVGGRRGTGEGNVISGNGVLGINGFGIMISGSSSYGYQATANRVEGNLIGTDVTGMLGLGNAAAGVFLLTVAGNTIGGVDDGAGNVIAHNGAGGVVLKSSAVRNPILGNAVLSNDGLGIDLGRDGVSANDLYDSDAGDNELQNFPLLTAAVSESAGLVVSGSLSTTPTTTFRLEFFENAACDPSGYGEGQRLLGSMSVTTDGDGYVNFTATMSPTVSPGQSVTATATDPNGNTSEFSPCATVMLP